jgi:hypothetical protein
MKPPECFVFFLGHSGFDSEKGSNRFFYAANNDPLDKLYTMYPPEGHSHISLTSFFGNTVLPDILTFVKCVGVQCFAASYQQML